MFAQEEVLFTYLERTRDENVDDDRGYEGRNLTRECNQGTKEKQNCHHSVLVDVCCGDGRKSRREWTISMSTAHTKYWTCGIYEKYSTSRAVIFSYTDTFQ